MLFSSLPGPAYSGSQSGTGWVLRLRSAVDKRKDTSSYYVSFKQTQEGGDGAGIEIVPRKHWGQKEVSTEFDTKGILVESPLRLKGTLRVEVSCHWKYLNWRHTCAIIQSLDLVPADSDINTRYLLRLIWVRSWKGPLVDTGRPWWMDHSWWYPSFRQEEVGEAGNSIAGILLISF